jgi:hypothetical protein
MGPLGKQLNAQPRHRMTAAAQISWRLVEVSALHHAQVCREGQEKARTTDCQANGIAENLLCPCIPGIDDYLPLTGLLVRMAIIAPRWRHKTPRNLSL